ncbi:hypothetical protein FLK61_26965 [Paenalkalicoccus suaedae]|uniref:Uncharacterized protein n=1 Tax=Paenalkalicoccus suaedae TaxID=2592382 RepID=A0A859FBI2_9BACI|nr:hypothetical protein [Paenalkalicoccus suaedae]QKS70397.1 hypothetical protein FLK61_26965 [Paenalkalicoccus suaedae]
MDRQLVAVLETLEQKEAVMRELEIKGVDKDDVYILSREDEGASAYDEHFEHGNFVVLVEVEREIGRIPVEDVDTIDQHRTPKGHHHMPHHQMKQGL